MYDSSEISYASLQDGGVLQSMKVEKFAIPSVFTYHWKGAEIVDLIKRHGPRKVRIALQEGSHCRTTSQVLFLYPFRQRYVLRKHLAQIS